MTTPREGEGLSLYDLLGVAPPGLPPERPNDPPPPDTIYTFTKETIDLDQEKFNRKRLLS
jgi:hypothetical protein